MAEKPNIKKSIDDGTYDTENLRQLLLDLVDAFDASIDKESSKWLMGFLHKDQKFLTYSRSEYLNLLLANVQIGYHLFASTQATGKKTLCRLSGTTLADVTDSYVTIGTNAFRFYNDKVKNPGKKAKTLSAQCALYSYLAQKLLGTATVSVGGNSPQAPKNYNLIFHYGQLDDIAVNQITTQLDLIWNLVWQHHGAKRIRNELNQHVKALNEKVERVKNTRKKQEINWELAERETELKHAEANQAAIEDKLFTACPWWKNTDSSVVPAENPSLDALTNIQSSVSKFDRHVLGLGMGNYRMILFVLPQIRAPHDKEHDFTQRRFSNSRVIVTAMLSLLRELSESDGPFYYQSLPTLTPDAFSSDTFFVRNKPVSVKRAQHEYEAVTQLAWKLIWQSGSDGLVRKVVLAEKLIAEPLSTFSTVMRDSPILGQTKGTYKRLRAPYRSDWGAYDLTEYAKFIQRLSELKEENLMAIQIDREKLDEFCPKLFRLLDHFGHLPLSLRAKPNEFEKYPRSLFGSILRNQDSEGSRDVEAGFFEWENKVLRRSLYRQEEDYLDYIEDLRAWMIGNQEVFTKSANLQHLKSSLYARVFRYVYPRRVLANSYCQKHKGNLDAIKEEVLAQLFPSSIETEVQKLKGNYVEDWAGILADTRINLTDAPYYRRVLENKEETDQPDESEATNSQN